MLGHLHACCIAVLSSSFFVFFRINFVLVPFYVERLRQLIECCVQIVFPFALCLSVDLSIGVSVCTDLGQLEIWAGVEVVMNAPTALPKVVNLMFKLVSFLFLINIFVSFRHLLGNLICRVRVKTVILIWNPVKIIKLQI